ncbi:Oligosaccaryltransferase-domain-containing protein [Xylaria sp. CBS 124048]|nr:Oligosaccaryltransferase-domain-containing protein [Xylaria sp. CBS 124048]
MISDDELYRLAIFLGSVAMLLIVVYHFFEVNSQDEGALPEKNSRAGPAQPPASPAKSSSEAK